MKKIILLFIVTAASMIAQPEADNLAMLQPPVDESVLDEMVVSPIMDELPPPGDARMDLGFMGGRIMEKLQLTPDQEKQFRTLQSAMQKEQIELRSQLQILHIDVRELFMDNNPNQGKIESKMDEIDKVQSKMRKNHLEFWFNVKKILTTDQQKVWKQHRMMLGEAMGARGGRGLLDECDRGVKSGGMRGGHKPTMQGCPSKIQ